MDATGQAGLWETNGTASGTFELAPIAGASSSGVSPSDLAVLNGEALFQGSASSAIAVTLWTTDGTAAGTVELTSGLPLFPVT
jgi:ELWxxDGT repeat protein